MGCESCLDPECCSIFYSFWCISVGILCSIHSLINLILYGDIAFIAATYSFIFFLGVTYAVAGFLLYVGIRINSELCFKVGKMLSYLFPINFFFIIFPLVVHCICVIKLCQYMKDTWPPI